MRRWRQIAHAAALQKGARRACGLCKRAMMGRGYVVLHPPWHTKVPRVRWLCSGCYRDLLAVLETWEYERDGYDLPIDKTATGLTKGTGKRGSQLD